MTPHKGKTTLYFTKNEQTNAVVNILFKKRRFD